MTPPRISSALPPYGCVKASPKAISRRTSYLRVRLEFLPYPQLIATLFNGCAFEPPGPFTVPSFCPWVDHPVSGLRHATCALFRLAFASDMMLYIFSCHILQLAGPFYKKYAVAPVMRGAPAGREHRVSGSLSLPSRGPFHLSLTVLYAIGHWVVFSLGGWSPRLPTRFPVSYGTPDPARPLRLPVRGFHTYRRLSQNRSSSLRFLNAVHNPKVQALWFRLFRVRSPLLAESLLFSLPLPT